jgi:hypothetical protein
MTFSPSDLCLIPRQNFYISHLSHACCKIGLPHLPSFDHPNHTSITWSIRIMVFIKSTHRFFSDPSLESRQYIRVKYRSGRNFAFLSSSDPTYAIYNCIYFRVFLLIYKTYPQRCCLAFTDGVSLGEILEITQYVQRPVSFTAFCWDCMFGTTCI